MNLGREELIKHVCALVLAIALVVLGCEACGPKPVPVPPIPTGAGGATGVGGATSGGSAGSTIVAGSAGMPEVAVRFPECSKSRKGPPRVRPPMSGWHPDKQREKRRRWRPTYQLLSVGDVFRYPNLLHALNQLNIGRCTGNAVAHDLSTDPFRLVLTEDDADKIYRRATEIDPYPGTYPPTDTGSNGASAWQAAIDLGYHHGSFYAVDSLEGLQEALQHVPCAFGTDWYDGFFDPSECGEASISGRVAGGHEIAIVGWDRKLRRVWFRNSWGDWGVNREEETGYAYFSAGTFQKLLQRGAEIDCPSAP